MKISGRWRRPWEKPTSNFPWPPHTSASKAWAKRRNGRNLAASCPLWDPCNTVKFNRLQEKKGGFENYLTKTKENKEQWMTLMRHRPPNTASSVLSPSSKDRFSSFKYNGEALKKKPQIRLNRTNGPRSRKFQDVGLASSFLEIYKAIPWTTMELIIRAKGGMYTPKLRKPLKCGIESIRRIRGTSK